MECLKVLVVHRQAALNEEVGSILQKFGPSIQRHSCGIDGLQAAKLEHFDLIVCGTDLPLITGFEMVRAIRNLSKNCFTPVIFISERLRQREETLSRQLNALAITGRQNLKGAFELLLAGALHFVEDNTALSAN